MNHLQKSVSLLVNIGLIALLASAWAASKYPHLSDTITIVAVFSAIAVSAIAPLVIRVALHRTDIEGVLNDLEQKSMLNQERPSDENIFTEARHFSLIQTTTHDVWRQYLSEIYNSRKIEKEILQNRYILETSPSKIHREGQNSSINIGVVNLFLSHDEASIKLRGEKVKPEKKMDNKINIVLVPEANDNFVIDTEKNVR